MARELDVIDANRSWSVWVGNRRHGYRVGTVKAANLESAWIAARLAWPSVHIGFVAEDRWDG